MSSTSTPSCVRFAGSSTGKAGDQIDAARPVRGWRVFLRDEHLAGLAVIVYPKPLRSKWTRTWRVIGGPDWIGELQVTAMLSFTPS
jgi:hypothetical protein